MQSQSRYVPIAVTLAVLFAMAGTMQAAEWPNWRGPNHDGISQEKGFETRWESPPPKVWEADLGAAYSTFTCVKGRVYTCGTKDKQQVLYCLDAKTGRVTWETPFESEYRSDQGSGTRATPTIDGGRVYIQGGHGYLGCFKADDGKELWNRRFSAAPKWGYSGSVLIEGDLAIVMPGGKDGALLALNKKTGKPVWTCGTSGAGYATPYPFTFEGRRYIVGFLAKEAMIADAKTGRQVWSMPWETSWDVNAASPIFHNGYLFLSSGYGHGAIVVKLSKSGTDLTSAKVWQNDTVQCKFQSAVLHEGHLYSAGETGLKCVEFATGREVWAHDRRVKHATIVVADGHLLVLTERGQLLIAKASKTGFEPITSVPLLSSKRSWTVPALYRGHLYVRDLHHAACFKLTRE